MNIINFQKCQKCIDDKSINITYILQYCLQILLGRIEQCMNQRSDIDISNLSELQYIIQR